MDRKARMAFIAIVFKDGTWASGPDWDTMKANLKKQGSNLSDADIRCYCIQPTSQDQEDAEILLTFDGWDVEARGKILSRADINLKEK